MDKEKQIEGMAEVLRHVCEGECIRNKDGLIDCEVCKACHLYEAGYRKQSEGEWISVDERLPESLQRVLVIDTKGDMFTSVYISFATGKNAWSTQNSYLGDVTHWMPLPVPPGMKGGAK